VFLVTAVSYTPKKFEMPDADMSILKYANFFFTGVSYTLKLVAPSFLATTVSYTPKNF
jgi:hypothetical protein